MDLKQEKQLIERAKNDPEAFGVLYDEYYGKIFGYALCRIASVASAQDVTSEVFFKALRNIKSFQWRGIPFSAWLYRIAEHEIGNLYSHNGHDRVLTDELKHTLELEDTSFEAETIEAEAELQKQADFLAVHASLSKLPSKYQEVIILRFFDKKQLNEITQILGKREGTVKSLLHRGLEKLRKLMEENATF
jgi:RNA polymerase sigma-70 factor (ECF subfamily)